MVWIYRWQQRIAITNRECLALLTLAGLFAAGLTARTVQSAAYDLPPDAYVETDRIFRTASLAAPEAEALPAPASLADTSATKRPASTVASTDERPASGDVPPADRPLARMNLNTATSGQLQQLPRIGPKTAERILAYRAAHGGFRSVEELVNVKGIGPKTLERLQPLVFVEQQ